MRYRWGDLISLEYGKPVKDKASLNGPVPVFGTNGKIGTSYLAPLCPNASFILGRKGAYRGVHYSNIPFSVIDTAFYAKNLAPDKLSLKWAYYKFLTYDINNMDSGSAIPSTDRYTIYAIEVELPTLEEQLRTVHLLEALDNKIEVNQRINDNLEQQLHLLFIQIFGKTNLDVPLGDVIQTTSGGTPFRKHYEYYDDGSICWVKSKELLGRYVHNTEEHINELAVSKSAAKLLPAHSVLIAMYGATVGAYGIISKPMACNQAICALLNNEEYPYTYLFQIACESQQKLVNLAVGSAQQNISQVLIKQLPVHSDKGRIREFHSLACPLHEKIEALQAENIKLSEMRDCLLPKLISGELDISTFDL